jgi:hypothetical protein
MTPVRAAWILGERREKKAVPALTKIVKKAKDASLVRECSGGAWENRGHRSDDGDARRNSAFKFARTRKGPRSFTADRIEGSGTSAG